MMTYTVMNCPPLYQFDRPSPETIAPMSEARTMSNSPALRATIEMISSGALPKVALSSPPTASPVREALLAKFVSFNGLNDLPSINSGPEQVEGNDLNFSDGFQLEVTAIQIVQQRAHMLGEISAAIAVEGYRESGPAGE